ncbi:histidinol dehydrogenase [Buchnera aphidicola]|uniref:histidinol dehydrogenase n=1 Tax=Buchnera aphidicola TaxID=9 RepID=UPI0031B71C20
MIQRNVIFWEKLNSEEKKRILIRPHLKNSNVVSKTVANIINDIKQFGDRAITKYTKEFDKVETNNFFLNQENISIDSLNIQDNFKKSILIAFKNINLFHKLQNNSRKEVETQPGIKCSKLVVPIQSVGLYVPGGSTSLFSTALMLAIPAKIAGCKNIFICSPPPISDELLYVAKLCGVHKVFQVGGAQAIAGLTFGTETIPKVDKIFGPGNVYVTEAKLQVSKSFHNVDIDMIAGPSELLVLADYTANPEFIVADLFSQAEHGSSSQVLLVTTCKKIATLTLSILLKKLNSFSDFHVIKNSIMNSRIIYSENMNECINIVNRYGPEHLIIQTNSPKKELSNIKNAGSIFLGKWSPVSAGDYASGTNHVLPTSGSVNTRSGLSVSDFQKQITVQELTKEGLKDLSFTIQTLAKQENMIEHSNAVQVRIDSFDSLKENYDI